MPNNFNYIKSFYYDYEEKDTCPVTCTACTRTRGRSYCHADSCTDNRIFDGLNCVNPPGTVERYDGTCYPSKIVETLLTFDKGHPND